MNFDVILADPPWQFRVWNKDTGQGRSAESHYSTMELSDICALDVPAKNNAVLFLWVTWPVLQEAFEVIRAWGFEYKTQAWTWIKSNPSGFGHFMGMGYYTRANAEPCLLCTRGNPGRPADKGVLSIIYAPVMQHSRKPDEQYAKIEALYPNRSYLEMFARRKRPGWYVWGNEIESDVTITQPNKAFQPNGYRLDC